MNKFRLATLVLIVSLLVFMPAGQAKDVDLRQHLEMLLDERTKQLETKFVAAEQAIKIASESLQRELEKLNQLRQEVVRDRSMFVGIEHFTSKIEGIDKDIQTLKERQVATETKAATWVIALGVFFALIQLSLSYLTKRKPFRKEDTCE